MPSVALTTPTTLMASGNAAHLWIFINWALGLRDAGARVFWTEVSSSASGHGPSQQLDRAVADLRWRLAPFGLDRDVTVISKKTGEVLAAPSEGDCRDADLLLNFNYGLSPELVAHWPRTALVDIDPGLLQLWWTRDEVRVAAHDHYFTIGETVGRSEARFPDCGVRWVYTAPPVHLPSWPVVEHLDSAAAYTTVTGWWDEWMEFGGEVFSNEKRVSYLEHLELPRSSGCGLEIAIIIDSLTRDTDVPLLRSNGWAVRDARTICATPVSFAQYVRGSRGEFSCARPSSKRLGTTWIGDRTLCYLASGLPACVENTASSIHDFDGDGLVRFASTGASTDEACRALLAIEGDRARHVRRARAIAEEYFDAKLVARRVLERVL